MLYVCADVCLAIYYSLSPRTGPALFLHQDLWLPSSLLYSFIIFYGSFVHLMSTQPPRGSTFLDFIHYLLPHSQIKNNNLGDI